VDIDVKIDGNAIERCKAFSNTQFAYFPVIFMRYPSAVKHPSGYWGSTGFGIMCTTKVGFIQANAVHGEDADDFQGWGGEDILMVGRLTSVSKVFRAPDFGLTHEWHPKACFLEDRMYVECLTVLRRSLGMS
jgi:hypothetical protein